MRKTIINSDTVNPHLRSQEKWLDLEELATVEVTAGILISRLNLL
jgi:hypothetical protein